MSSHNQIQINLDNNTANFHAQHAALALTQKSWLKNTTRAYTHIVKDWKVCKFHNIESEFADMLAVILQKMQIWQWWNGTRGQTYLFFFQKKS